MIISDIEKIEGRHFPARRHTQPLAGGGTPIPTETFSVGHVTIEPNGGQVPWHNQEMEEIYVVVEGSGEMCLGEERQTVTAGQAIFIPPGTYHQLSNLGNERLVMNVRLWGGPRCASPARNGWDFAQGGCRCSGSTRRRPSTVHGSAWLEEVGGRRSAEDTFFFFLWFLSDFRLLDAPLRLGHRSSRTTFPCVLWFQASWR